MSAIQLHHLSSDDAAKHEHVCANVQQLTTTIKTTVQKALRISVDAGSLKEQSFNILIVHLPVLCEFLKVVVFVDGVVHSQVDQLLQSLVDEDDADQRSESFLSEACDVTDKRAGICGHQ